MSNSVILSGYQPSGRSHIGNYLGAIKNFVELQKNYDCYFFIANYHSITEDYDPSEKPRQTIDVAADFLAAGLDPKKCALFVQSDVPAHLELAWIFNTITPMGYLKRMTQFKDKAKQQERNINVGLFDYPVLQAADILLYKPYAVPVGKDQEQHLELARMIARIYNKRFGKIFDEPKTLLTETPTVMSLLYPDKKMSKSLGDKHCVYLDDEPKDIHEKLKKAVSDTGDGKSTGAKNLLGLLKAFGETRIYEKYRDAQKEGKIRYADLKKDIADAISAYFSDFRNKKKELKKSPSLIMTILMEGAKKARKVADRTLSEVKQQMGINYRMKNQE